MRPQLLSWQRTQLEEQPLREKEGAAQGLVLRPRGCYSALPFEPKRFEPIYLNQTRQDKNSSLHLLAMGGLQSRACLQVPRRHSLESGNVCLNKCLPCRATGWHICNLKDGLQAGPLQAGPLQVQGRLTGRFMLVAQPGGEHSCRLAGLSR